MGHRFVENGGGNVSGLFIFVQMKSNNNKKSVIQFFFQEINFILISRKKNSYYYGQINRYFVQIG